MRSGKFLSESLLAAALIAGLPFASALWVSPAPVLASDVSDAQLTAALRQRLQGKNLKGVTVMVQHGTAILSGQVSLYAYKLDAIKKAKKAAGVKDVRDNIAVGGPTIPDDVLQQKLLAKIQMDRVGYGQVFDAIAVQVRNGAVTLGGHALGPVAEQSAVALTSFEPGVKAIVNEIRIDPVSSMDDGIRRRVYLAIYGYSALNRYALVPWKPIRISVQNGRVTLYGIVDSQMDSQLAYTRAMTVPGIFQVTNDLVVRNQANEKR